MARKTDVDILLDRTRPDSVHFEPQSEKRYVFNGDPQSKIAGYAVRQNKRGVRRTRSTFNIILILFGCAVAIILYISNIIAVNNLAFETGQLQAKYDKIVNTNGALKAEINRKSGWERINKIATEQLGLRYPKEQPTWFDIDEDKLELVKGD